jgi:hypothetical protein
MVEGRDHLSGESVIITGPPDHRGPDIYVHGAIVADDQDFIANAKQDIPTLIAEIRRLRGEVERLQAAIALRDGPSERPSGG